MTITTNSSNVSILSFYSFVKIQDPETLLPKILLIGKKKYIKGTILIASEGFNGTISGNEDNLHLILSEIKKLTEAKNINIKINYSHEHPFNRLKVKIKNEIITMKKDDIDVHSLRGEYIETNDWDSFIANEEVLLIDTRNKYEVEVGTFTGAVNPEINTFKEFPNWVDNNKQLFQNKKIAMYCTGGVRCEKSTAYLKSLGFKDVYHLRGGILQYLQDTSNSNGKWLGECFVFDERKRVDSNLRTSS